MQRITKLTNLLQKDDDSDIPCRDTSELRVFSSNNIFISNHDDWLENTRNRSHMWTPSHIDNNKR